MPDELYLGMEQPFSLTETGSGQTGLQRTVYPGRMDEADYLQAGVSLNDLAGVSAAQLEPCEERPRRDRPWTKVTADAAETSSMS